MSRSVRLSAPSYDHNDSSPIDGHYGLPVRITEAYVMWTFTSQSVAQLRCARPITKHWTCRRATHSLIQPAFPRCDRSVIYFHAQNPFTRGGGGDDGALGRLDKRTAGYYTLDGCSNLFTNSAAVNAAASAAAAGNETSSLEEHPAANTAAARRANQPNNRPGTSGSLEL